MCFTLSVVNIKYPNRHKDRKWKQRMAQSKRRNGEEKILQMKNFLSPVLFLGGRAVGLRRVDVVVFGKR